MIHVRKRTLFWLLLVVLVSLLVSLVAALYSQVLDLLWAQLLLFFLALAALGKMVEEIHGKDHTDQN